MTELVLYLAGAAIAVIALAGYLMGRQKRRFKERHGFHHGDLIARPSREKSSLEGFKGRRGIDARDDTGRQGLAHEVLEPVPADETLDEAKLRKLREFQRAEKIREAREDELRAAQPPVVEIEDERTVRLREFQRQEKAREALEEERLRGPVVDIPEPTVEQMIAHAIIDLRKEEAHFEPKQDPAYTSVAIAHARDLINDLNRQFGWQLGEPSIADRLFNTDVETVIGTAQSTQQVDFRLERMISVMHGYVRASTGGRNELAEVMATRVILGTGKLTNEELSKLDTARRLFGDRFAEAAGYVDHMTEAQERNAAKRLGLNQTPERDQDRSINRGGPSFSR